MGKNRSSLLGLIALIIGMSGLGLGIFTFVDPFEIEEPEGIEYPVSSESEIISALNAIGKGFGIITITTNITLTNMIEINSGGNYIIQGAGAVIKCASNQGAFNITNTDSLTIQNIEIDTSDVVTANLNIIRINEENDNIIYIRNVHIIGDSNTIGRGI